MKIIRGIIGVALAASLIGCSSAPHESEASGSEASDSELSKTEQAQDACERATSPSANREQAWKDLARLEPGLGIGPLSRLTLRSTKQGNNTEAARTLALLKEACGRL